MKKIIKQLWKWILILLGRKNKSDRKQLIWDGYYIICDFNKFERCLTPRVPAINLTYNVKILS